MQKFVAFINEKKEFPEKLSGWFDACHLLEGHFVTVAPDWPMCSCNVRRHI
jgi:hypothetical protein